jgi:hypothetical protein
MERLAELSGKSVMAGTIPYALGLCEGLVRFFDEGRIEIDSNTVERSMRPVALNRRNVLSADSDQGGANWALHFYLAPSNRVDHRQNRHRPHRRGPTAARSSWMTVQLL